jgi:hypothetical protein
MLILDHANENIAGPIKHFLARHLMWIEDQPRAATAKQQESTRGEESHSIETPTGSFLFPAHFSFAHWRESRLAV